MRATTFAIALLLAVGTDARPQRPDRDDRPARPSNSNAGGRVDNVDSDEDYDDEYDLEDLEDMYGSESDSDGSMDSDSDSDYDFEMVMSNAMHPEKKESNMYNDPSSTDAEHFSMWATRFNKRYETLRDFEDHLDTWKHTRDVVVEANANAGNDPNAPHLTMENIFADGERRTGRLSSPRNRNLEDIPAHEPRNLDATQEIDWLHKMTPVKDQGSCGSCYAFAGNSALEAMVAISSGEDPVRLSEQELVDCTNAYGNYGCNGGLEINGWNYQQAGAISDADYPYFSGSTYSAGTCASSGKTPIAKVDSYTGWYDFVGADEIIDRLADGPVTLGIQGENTYFYQYESGTLDSSNCDGSAIDHAVVITGFNPGSGESTEPVTEIVTYTKTRCRKRRRRDYRAPSGCRKSDWYVHDTYRRFCCRDYEWTEEVVIEEGSAATDAYFIIQNSWGTNWGEEGFVKFKYEPNSSMGACGMNREPFQVFGSKM